MRRTLLILGLLAPLLARAAAPTYVGVGSTAPVLSATTCTPTTASVTRQAGDLLLVIAEGEGAGAGNISLSTANGFTLVPNTAQRWNDADATDETGETAVAVFYRIATGASDAMPVVADSGDHTSCLLVVLRGVDTTTPIACSAGDATDASDTSGSFPSCTTGVADTMVVLAEAITDDAADTTNSSGYANANLATITEREDQTVATNLGGGIAFVTATYSGTGDFGATTYTADNARRKALASIAVAPVPPPASNVVHEGSVYSTDGAGQATASISSSFTAGELLVVAASWAGNVTNSDGTTSVTLPSGAGTETRRVSYASTDGQSYVAIWTSVATATSSGTFSAASSAGGTQDTVVRVSRFSGAGLAGTPNTGQNRGTTTLATVDCTASATTSRIASAAVEWDSSTARTVSSGQVMLAERISPNASVHWTQLTDGGTGATGTVTSGISAPTGTKWAMVALELVEASGGEARSGTATSVTADGALSTPAGTRASSGSSSGVTADGALSTTLGERTGLGTAAALAAAAALGSTSATRQGSGSVAGVAADGVLAAAGGARVSAGTALALVADGVLAAVPGLRAASGAVSALAAAAGLSTVDGDSGVGEERSGTAVLLAAVASLDSALGAPGRSGTAAALGTGGTADCTAVERELRLLRRRCGKTIP